MPFCDHTKPTAVRVQDMIARMTLDEKCSQVGWDLKQLLQASPVCWILYLSVACHLLFSHLPFDALFNAGG